MSLIISGKDFKLTPSLKAYVTEKTDRFFKYHGKIEKIRVELDVDHNQRSGDIYRVEIWVTVPGRVLRIGAKAADMRAAIDETADSMNRLLVKDKEKIQTRRRQPGGTDL